MLNKKHQKSQLAQLIKRDLLVSSLTFIMMAASSQSIMAFNSAVVEAAKVTEGANANIYSASFFEQYLPQNAREMVDRIPGFSFDGGSNDRGFGGNAGNVLIDGSRPTSKSGGLHAALVRIPAEQVERIEILRGGVGAGEASGQSVVANVVRKGEGTSGTWALKFRRAPKGETLPNIEAAVTTQYGEWKTAFDLDIGGGPGYRTAIFEVRDADNLLTSSSDEVLSDRGKWAFFNGEGSREVSDGLLTLNGRIGGDRYTSDTRKENFAGRLPDESQFESYWDLAEERDFKMAEFGIDWVKSTDDWKSHILGIAIINDINYQNQTNEGDYITNELGDSDFVTDISKSEFIARLTYGNVSKQQFKPEYGVEIAENVQSKKSIYNRNGLNVPFDGSDRKVKELRSELFASFVYQQSDKLSFEGGLTAEFSRVTVSGDASNKINYQFLKPRLSSIYKMDKDTRLIVDAGRGVNQLALDAFAANVQTSDDVISAGNSNLAPEINDELSVTYDWTFHERGNLKVKVFHEWRSDILEDIKLTEDESGYFTSGTGNAGDADFYGVQTDINLPLDWILKNGLIEISHGYRKSSFDDPIINSQRNVNGFIPRWLNFKFRQDITEHQFAWGVDFWSDYLETGYRVGERITFGANNRFRVFVETSQFFGLKTQLEIHHINTGEYTRSRFFYGRNVEGELVSGDRSDTYTGSEVAYRQREPEIKLSIWGTF